MRLYRVPHTGGIAALDLLKGTIINHLREQFMLGGQIAFLNHGSFGACPKPIFEVYQAWQRELERQPVEFLSRRIEGLLDDARSILAGYINADADDVVFVQNATAGVNIAARSIRLEGGDEILTTDHEYGACDFTWEDVCAETGARYIRRAVPLPLESPDALVDDLLAGVTARTKVIFLSHITSSTALIFPVAEICRRAREMEIITVVDGAHAPGQLLVDLRAIDADFYTGNCHKWMCAPKGSAFLYVRKEHQAKVEPLATSWGRAHGDTFITRHQMQGTRDPSAYLTVPAAIQFMQENDWHVVQQECHALAVDLRRRIDAFFGHDPLAPEDAFAQMFTVALPPCDPLVIKSRLYDEFSIEVPIIVWNDRQYLRVSIQAYNTREDCERLLGALAALFG